MDFLNLEVKPAPIAIQRIPSSSTHPSDLRRELLPHMNAPKKNERKIHFAIAGDRVSLSHEIASGDKTGSDLVVAAMKKCDWTQPRRVKLFLAFRNGRWMDTGDDDFTEVKRGQVPESLTEISDLLFPLGSLFISNNRNDVHFIVSYTPEDAQAPHEADNANDKGISARAGLVLTRFTSCGWRICRSTWSGLIGHQLRIALLILVMAFIVAVCQIYVATQENPSKTAGRIAAIGKSLRVLLEAWFRALQAT
ncbi:hypothetical protein PF010_g6592 [Phytophthora fragariae]|uniref:Uncharacterized protein n=2 Tax=Phytophthora fragariae TaxID=53985 RepID=A0A6G0LK73_9STRA|nr:hypothetical protein PF010_g6592 [Phytophthora fragariae]